MKFCCCEGHSFPVQRGIYVSMPFGRASFAVGGHRGCGENLFRLTNRAPGQKAVTGTRENTIKSFLKSSSHNVDFIEFDVQVTKDGVPVIFHDDVVVHGSLCTPHRSLISQLTLAEFQQLGQTLRWFRNADTKEWLLYDNVWDCDDEDTMPTLLEAFEQVPQHVGFNIEVKLATSPALNGTPLCEVRRIVDALLPVVHRMRATRQIVISSFDPDVMQYLASAASGHQLADVPLWYLSTGGASYHADSRRTSLAAAIEFAHSAGMQGIVVDSGKLKLQPEAVAEAAAAGLKVMTYGLPNDDIEWVLHQKALGVVGGIVDDVQGVVGKLRTVEAMQSVTEVLEDIVITMDIQCPPMVVPVQ